MTVLASSLRQMSSSSALTFALSEFLRSISKYLPWRTCSMPEKPSEPKAPSMALPCGSSTPFFKVTLIFACIRCSIAFDELRTRTLGLAELGHDAETLRHFLIGFDETAHVTAEAVLVQLVLGLDIPKAAGIRADLVGENDTHHVIFIEPAELDLEVDELDADAEEKPRHEIIDADGEMHHVVDLLGRRPVERRDVLLGDHRITQLILLVIEFDDGTRQRSALFDAETLGKRSRGDIAHHDLERNDLDLANQLLAHIEALQEMGRQ